MMVEVMAGAIDENNASCQDICAHACERCDDRIVAKGYLDGIEDMKDCSVDLMGVAGHRLTVL